MGAAWLECAPTMCDREHVCAVQDSAGGGGEQGHPWAPLLVSQIVLVSHDGQHWHMARVFTLLLAGEICSPC